MAIVCGVPNFRIRDDNTVSLYEPMNGNLFCILMMIL